MEKQVLVGVINHEGKYLVLKRSLNQKYDPERWEFVSMMVKGNEGIQELQHRVVKESGLKVSSVKQGKLFRVIDEYGSWLVQPFLFEVINDKVKLDNDHTDSKWVKKSEIYELNTVKDLIRNLEGFSDKKRSAGLLLYRRKPNLEVMLVHPGGPFWAKKDAWGIPKGEYDEDEDPLTVAKREFEEETSQKAPSGDYIELGEVKIASGKVIKAWAVEGDMDVSTIISNTIFIDWPPRRGKQLEIPEVDKAAWINAAEAITKMHKKQEIFIERLAEKLNIQLDAKLLEQPSLF